MSFRPNILVVDDSSYSLLRAFNGAPILAPEKVRITLVSIAGSAPGVSDREVFRVIPAGLDGGCQEIVEKLRKVGPFDYVVGVSEATLMPAAQLRELLGVDGASVAEVLTVRDKVVMKEHFGAAGIAVPECVRLPNTAGASELLAKYGKIVVKPTNMSGSRHVAFVDSDAALREALKASRSMSIAFEAEEYVEGDLFHLNSVVEGGEVLKFSISRYLDPLTGIGCGSVVRSVELDDGELFESLRGTNERITQAMSWHSGVTHLELFCAPGGQPILCEVGARCGGGGIIPTFFHRFGVDLRRAAIEGQVGGSLAAQVQQEGMGADTQTGWMNIYPPSVGVLAPPLGIPNEEWLVSYDMRMPINRLLADPRHSDDAAATVSVAGPDSATVTARLDALRGTLVIR